MIALRLVRVIETNSDLLARELLEKLRRSPYTASLNNVPGEELQARSESIFRNLSEWLLHKSEPEIERVYSELGTRRARQGVALSQLFAAFMITRTHLWEFLERHGVPDKPGDLYGELDLLRHLDRFFDRALYYAAEGYEAELRNRQRSALPAS
jgi:hypothetical protein